MGHIEKAPCFLFTSLIRWEGRKGLGVWEFMAESGLGGLGFRVESWAFRQVFAADLFTANNQPKAISANPRPEDMDEAQA